MAVAMLALVTFISYWPVTQLGFLDWLDPEFIYDNPHVRSGLSWENFVWSWSIHSSGQWHPLAWWSSQLDCQLFGLEPGGHHLGNALLHVVAALILCAAFRALTGVFWPSLLVAAWFALHPISAESVAWASARHDMLGAIFWGLSIWAYAAYTRRGGLRRYLGFLFLLMVGLLASPLLVALPLVLLLLDYWPLQRVARFETARSSPCCPPQTFGRLLAEKFPLFILVAAASSLSLHGQQHGGVGVRVANAAQSGALHLWQLLWPLNLSAVDRDAGSIWTWHLVGAIALLIGLTILSFYLGRSRRWLLVGWLWYLVMLLSGHLVFGLSQGDRQAYLPSIGLYLLLSWLLHEVFSVWRPGRLIVPMAIVALIACGALTWRQVTFWTDSTTLYQRAVEVGPDNPNALARLGVAMVGQGQASAGERYLRQALELGGNRPQTYYNLGLALHQQQKLEQAAQSFNKAIELGIPTPEIVFNNLGLTFFEWQRLDQAESSFREAIRLKLDFSEPHNHLGRLFRHRGELVEAEMEFRNALRIAPDSSSAHNNLGELLRDRDDAQGAIKEFREATRLDPNLAMAHYNLAILLDKRGDYAGSKSALLAALAAQEDFDPALQLLTQLYEKTGELAQPIDLDEATESGDENLVLLIFAAAPFVVGASIYVFFGFYRFHESLAWHSLRLVAGNVLVLSLLLSLVVLTGECYYRFFCDRTDSFGLTKTHKRWVKRHYHFNSLGVRDSVDYRIAVEPGQRRVTFLGDSFTAAHGVRNVEHGFVNLIRRSHPDWDIQAIANNGFDTGQHLNSLAWLLRLEHLPEWSDLRYDPAGRFVVGEGFGGLSGLRLLGKNEQGQIVLREPSQNGKRLGKLVVIDDDPDRPLVNFRCQLQTVVWIYVLNDITDIMPQWQMVMQRIYSESEPGWLGRNSYLFNMLHYRWYAARDPDIANFFSFTSEAYRPDGPIWNVHRVRLQLLDRLVRTGGGKLMVATFPFLDQLGPDYPFAQAHQLLDQFWRSIGVPHLDLLNIYEDYNPDDLTLHAYDAHPNRQAHEMAAEAISAFIKKN